jgi:DNA invertase Pin-like site-specific DNA recombinase
VTRRVAIYARFSTDQQNPASIADQVAECRRLAERLGAEVVDVFSDAEISGNTIANRPGLLALMSAAGRGAFDLVLAEGLERLARRGSDSWTVYEDLEELGIGIHTHLEGDVDPLKVGFKGTMNAQVLRELPVKVRRGMRGVISSGRVLTTPYGYRIKRKIDGRGELIRGLREIDETQARVVRRIFHDYASGLAERAIAQALNKEGIPSAKGVGWSPTALRALLTNDIYRGVLIWGATRTRKHRSGRRSMVAAPASEVTREMRPDLRIVSDDDWEAVQAHRARWASHGRPERAKRPKRLLSGIVVCGYCGSPMTVTMCGNRRYPARPRLRCVTRVEKGLSMCSNTRTAAVEDVDRRIIAAVQSRLLNPAAIESAVREAHRILAETSRERAGARASLSKDLAEARRRASNLVDRIADGSVSGPTVKAKLEELERRIASLSRGLADLEAQDNIVELHPAAASSWRKMVEELESELVGDDASASAARDAFRKLVGKVVLTPEEGRGQYRLEIQGDLAQLVTLATRQSVTLSATEYRIQA